MQPSPQLRDLEAASAERAFSYMRAVLSRRHDLPTFCRVQPPSLCELRCPRRTRPTSQRTRLHSLQGTTAGTDRVDTKIEKPLAVPGARCPDPDPRFDDDGMLVIRGRLTPEAGAVVQRALEAASDPPSRLRRFGGTGRLFHDTE